MSETVGNAMTGTTIAQLYRETRDRLRATPVDSPEREALLLCEQILGIRGRAALAVRGGETVPAAAVSRLEQAVAQRATRPLQYILGQWQFCDMALEVGEGVLVPREDTTALVDVVCEGLSGVRAPRVLDLCAGSGAVGLAVLRRIPDASCVFLELSDAALPYLTRNVERYADGRATVVQGDVLQPPAASLPPDARFNAICSNPPYIPTGEIATLAREVQQEPALALDGGTDGLTFYHAICERWTPLLALGGLLAVEIGQGQHTDVCAMFERCGLGDIGTRCDMGGIVRAINGTQKRAF